MDKYCCRKISNQAKVLKQFQLPQYTQLLQYIDEIEFNDSTNREGHSAKVYFNALFGKSFSRKMIVPLMLCLIMVIVSYFLLLTGKLCQMVT